uniref:Secreted protein n=1 Tax=Setaria viridis TaxID=4556 RepID=A0A4V6D7R1_SETVI|nr:hypothetical protein SEVIR_4G003101v2 [Setaria viridis]
MPALSFPFLSFLSAGLLTLPAKPQTFLLLPCPLHTCNHYGAHSRTTPGAGGFAFALHLCICSAI